MGLLGSMFGWLTGGGGEKDKTSYTGQGNSYKVGDVATEGINSSQDSMTQMIRSLTNLTGTSGKDALGTGSDVFKQGVASFDSPQKFWSSILSGDRTAMSDTLAPEVSSIVSQYDAGRKAMSQFGARGGGKNAVLAEMPQKQSGDINKLFQSLRPEAAKQMQSIAQMLSSLGLNQEQIGSTLLGLTGQTMMQERGQDLQESMGNKEMAAGAGEGLGKIFSTLLSPGGLLNKKK